MKDAKSSWFELMKVVNVDEKLSAGYWEDINAAYTENGRFYHTLEHIEQMLNAAKKHRNKLKDLLTVRLAIFYHDIVYHATNSNNEEQSAELARRHLENMAINSETIEKCYRYIVATKGHSGAEDNDLSYFLDFDLEKLGAPWDEYKTYTRQIRKEYIIYPDELYNEGRKNVLNHFLYLESIFKTDEFYSLYEKQARANLKRELQKL